MLAAGTAGGLFYSFHLGRTQERTVCNEEKLILELAQTKKQLELEKELAKLKLEQLGEAQEQLKKETELNVQLKDDLSKALSINSDGCITPGMLDAIKKYRGSATNKNS